MKDVRVCIESEFSLICDENLVSCTALDIVWSIGPGPNSLPRDAVTAGADQSGVLATNAGNYKRVSMSELPDNTAE